MARTQGGVCRPRPRIVGTREDEAALRVSLADKLYNTRSILADVRESGEAVFERFSGKRDGTLWYYAALVDALRGFPNRMVDELDRTVASYGARSPIPSPVPPPATPSAFASRCRSPVGRLPRTRRRPYRPAPMTTRIIPGFLPSTAGFAFPNPSRTSPSGGSASPAW